MSEQNPANAADKLWGGRFTEATDAFVEAFTASVTFDKRMAEQDINGSIAHATMLAAVGVLTDAEKQQIIDGLEQIRLVRDMLAGFPAPAHVDEICAALDGRNTAKRSSRVAQVLDTLVATGLARPDAAGDRARYFVPR